MNATELLHFRNSLNRGDIVTLKWHRWTGVGSSPGTVIDIKCGKTKVKVRSFFGQVYCFDLSQSNRLRIDDTLEAELALRIG